MPYFADHHLHYRCAFELAPSQPTERSWGDLLRTVRKWIADKVPSDPANPDLQAAWFYSGGEWRPPRLPRWYVRTSSHKGAGDEHYSQYWSLRWEHPCSEVASRQWRTDIGLTARGPHTFIFSLSTTHWLMPGFLGKEPESPVPSAPGIVTRLLSSRYWCGRAGSEQLGTFPFLLRDGHANLLLEHLRNPDRACPLVLIAKDFATGANLVDPDRLGKLLAGAAVVWESESSWVDKELEALLDRSFSCWNGMVRVYQPRLRLNVPEDCRRHRYFSGNDVRMLGQSATEEALVRGVVRRARPVAFSDVTTIEDVEDKQRDARLADLKSATKGSQEWADLLEKELERLETEVKEHKEEAERIPELEDQIDDLRDDMKRVQFQMENANARAQEAEAVKASLAVRAAVFDKLDRFPESVRDVVDLIGKVYSDRIVFTEKAKESARSATLKDCNVAFECLRAMALTLHDLHFRDGLALREICERFRNSTGFELAIGESETTKANKKLAAMRKDVYNGERIEIGPHVKHGTAPGRILRVHYCAHPRHKLIIVGHCGDHLDTSRSN